MVIYAGKGKRSISRGSDIRTVQATMEIHTGHDTALMGICSPYSHETLCLSLALRNEGKADHLV